MGFGLSHGKLSGVMIPVELCYVFPSISVVAILANLVPASLPFPCIKGDLWIEVTGCHG